MFYKENEGKNGEHGNCLNSRARPNILLLAVKWNENWRCQDRNDAWNSSFLIHITYGILYYTLNHLSRCNWSKIPRRVSIRHHFMRWRISRRAKFDRIWKEKLISGEKLMRFKSNLFFLVSPDAKWIAFSSSFRSINRSQTDGGNPIDQRHNLIQFCPVPYSILASIELTHL